MEETMAAFENMLDEQTKPLHSGDVVEGTIEEINDDSAILNIGSNMDGVLTKDQLSDNETMDQFKVGDKVKLIVKKVDTKNTQYLLSKKDADRIRIWDDLEKMKEEDQPLTVKVVAVVKGGLRVRYQGIQGFIPASHANIRYVEDLSQFVGQEEETEILEINRDRHEFTASRRNFLVKKEREMKERAMEQLQVGDHVHGKVVGIEKYGAFVEIAPGVTGLLHIGDMSWTHIRRPENVVKMGQEIDVAVNQIDKEKGRIGLSLKDMVPNPWENLPFGVGDILDGCSVNRIINSGAFVQVAEMLEGFLPISQIVNRRIETVNEVLKVGDLVSVRVINIDPAQQRLTVTMKGVDQQNVDLSKPEEEAPAEAEEEAESKEEAPAAEAPAEEVPAEQAETAETEKAEEAAAEAPEAAEEEEKPAEETSEQQ